MTGDSQPGPRGRSRLALLATLRTRLDQAAAGQRVLTVVYGDPGHGKSTVLADAATHAASTEATVVRLAGRRPDVDIPYSGIHALLADHLPLVGPQGSSAQRLLSALVNDFVPPSSPLAVCGAVTAWLDCLAPAASVALLVDDADRVDEETLRVLAYVASREAAGRVALICTAGATVPLLDRVGAARLDLEDLDDTAAATVLAGRGMRRPLAERVVGRLGGNPLALHFAAAQLEGSTEAAGLVDLPGAAPLHPRLADHVDGQVAALPPDAADLVEAAAVAGVTDLTTITRWAAEQELGPAGRLLARAEDAGLLTTDREHLVWARGWMAEGVARRCPIGRRQRLLAQLRTSPPPRAEVAPSAVLRGAPAALLTMAERRVARVVLDGATTREAAARLGISSKTVDAHVQHIYRKLDVRSRIQLAATLLPHLDALGGRADGAWPHAPTAR